MSTPPQVLILAPDGTPGNVPFSQLHDALSAGGKVARKVQAPDGTPGYVSVDRFNDAVKAGAKPIPFDESDGQKPGFWSQVGTKLQSQMPSASQALQGVAGTGGKVYDLAQTAINQGVGSAAWKLAQETPGVPQAIEYLRSRSTGSSVAGSALNAAGTAVGVNPAQEEANARAGNTAGVAADAAVPAAEALLGYGVGAGTRALAGPVADALSANKPTIMAGAEALQHPAALPGKAAVKLASLIPDSPEVAAAKARVAQEAAGEQVVQAMKLQDPVLRREALAKAKVDAIAAKAAAGPVKPLSPIYGPPSPTPEQLAQGVKLSDLTGEKPSGITVVPEPRPTFAGETPNYMASVPRGTLQDLALGAKPGAAKQLQQLGQQIIYAPSGAGISNVRSSVPLSELANTGAAAAEPNYLYRIRPVGEEGVPKGAGNSPAQLTSSLEQAESWVPSKNKAGPHEIIRVDANSLKPGQTTVRPFSEDIDWHRVNQSIPESQVEVVRPHQAEVESD